jgi:arginyl-tRNA synthetase
VDVPALIRKSDGGFNYMTTDLATVDHRLRTWAPDEILYVVDDRQSGHFRALFHVFARWQPGVCGKTRLRHIGFGKILGDDGKPFKTRSGDTVRLADVLDEAEERALKVVDEKRPDLPEAERREIARIVGIGAVKWQDLLPNRQSDYVFSWDKMLALQGNTAPYVQYQYTRAAKVVRDAGEGSGTSGTSGTAGVVPEVVLTEPAERALARHLMNLGYTLEAAAQECRPNYLCNYLHELAGLYSAFYEACPVLKAAEPARSTRLALCRLSAQVLRLGLETLGIEVTEKM